MAPSLADFKCLSPDSHCVLSLLTPHTTDSSLAFFLISSLITIARIALRIQKRMFWLDDFFALLSLACFTVFVPGKSNFLHRPLPIIPTTLEVCLSSQTVPLSR